ncbi:hypothetical protein L873DRAFT_974098 [Choiromyces venosus 120613-1]|uniref:Uncharacterized protein n=1 Tax=Choiromyces venosus 120613-1 TaxID=1336337 RepID=A0A3N4JLG0_9PEZI|nr:hypothetical protein L873DRAFT_974098 [Choiromyces venosus 120613-1]
MMKLLRISNCGVARGFSFTFPPLPSDSVCRHPLDSNLSSPDLSAGSRIYDEVMESGYVHGGIQWSRRRSQFPDVPRASTLNPVIFYAFNIALSFHGQAKLAMLKGDEENKFLRAFFLTRPSSGQGVSLNDRTIGSLGSVFEGGFCSWIEYYICNRASTVLGFT